MQASPAVPLAAHPLVHLNVCLNLTSLILLLAAVRQIKSGHEAKHGRTMTAALVVSAAFLVSYLTYHAISGHVEFTGTGIVRYFYFAVLISHIVLAATVPFLAIPSAYFGARSLGWFGTAQPDAGDLAKFRARHRRLVRWAFPIWLYVSATGVVVYLMLYVLWPAAPS